MGSDMASDQSFNDWLKKRRKSLDLTQKELALQAGCSISTVQHIEEGVLKPSRQLADLLAASLEIPPEERPSFVRWARTSPNTNAETAQPLIAIPSANFLSSAPSDNGSVPAPATLEVAQLTNPYKGLRAFHEADAPDFFGREELSQKLHARLAQAQESRVSRFLAVVGPSGSGKSSVVRAGLVP
jgi:transcriptional regulator with XRE-family HTH domain